jgi:hypothetical protein
MSEMENIMDKYERHRQVRAKLNEGNKGAVFDAARRGEHHRSEGRF